MRLREEEARKLIGTMHEGFQILEGYVVQGKFLHAWCDRCEKWHEHGFPKGSKFLDLTHRVAHCNRYDLPIPVLRHQGYYILPLEGPKPKKERTFRRPRQTQKFFSARDAFDSAKKLVL